MLVGKSKLYFIKQIAQSKINQGGSAMRKFHDTGQALSLGTCKKNMNASTSTAIGPAGHFDSGHLHATPVTTYMKNVDIIGAAKGSYA
ncbi:MAG TPA: hypothetical protein DDY52_04650 [Candidatus Moranbacteria bacterium]|nr:hypothetical protein [Candidatus Moranbacteria bacterium]